MEPGPKFEPTRGARALDETHHGDRVAGFWVDCDDPASQVGAEAEWVDDVEEIGRDQRRGDPSGESDDPVTQRAGGGGLGCRCCHRSTIASDGYKLLSIERETST